MTKNQRTAFAMVCIVIGMGCLSYASVPLYSLFCKVTGYGGTPKTESSMEGIAPGTRRLTVRFNADVSPDLNWQFGPSQGPMEVLTGEQHLAFFHSENLDDVPVTGMAIYNVTPEKAAKYFNKIQCFCFNRQTLEPHKKVEMPVSFFLDPSLEQDPEMADIDTITLSYTFFPAR